MKQKKQRARHKQWFEYAALMFGVAWVPPTPRRAVIWLSRQCGAIAYRYAAKPNQIIRQNLELVYQETISEEQRHESLENRFQSFALLVLDSIWFSFRPHQRLQKFVHFDESCAMPSRDEPLVLLSGHFGNWEAAGMAFALGGALHSVAATIKNCYVDQKL